MSQAESERYLGDESTYVPLSITAVVAFLLALLASGGVFVSILSFVGPMAIAVSLMALYLFRFRAGTIRGKGLAMVALGLAVLFTSWSLTRLFCHRWWLYQHAEQYTRDWLQWVEQGKLAEAFAHTRAAGAKNPMTGQIEANQGREFFDTEGLKVVRSGKAELRSVTRLGILEGDKRAYIRLRYDYAVEENGSERIVPVMIEVMRTYRADYGGYAWFITEVN